jgi:integrase
MEGEMKRRPLRERNLYKRGGVYYWREKIGAHGYNESLQTSSKEEAIKRRDVKRARAESGDWQGLYKTRVKRSCSTAAELLAAYVEAARLYRPRNRGKPSEKTVKANAARFRKILSVTGHSLDDGLEVLSESLVADFETAMLEEQDDWDRAAVTCRSYLTQARSLFAGWTEHYYQNANLFIPDVRGFMSGGEVRGQMKNYTLPPQELIDVTMKEAAGLDVCDPVERRYRLVFLLCYNLGLRQSEAVDIRPGWFEENRGPDGPEIYCVIRRRPEEHYVPKGIDHKVRVRPETRDEIFSLAADGEFILPGGVTERKNLINREFSAWMKSLGWTRRMKAHELRKLAGSEWYTKLGPAVAKEWLGHSKIETTIKHYAALNSHPLPPM